MTGVDIRALGPDDADACDRIVAGLPYHFALEQGRLDCAVAVRRDPGLVADEDGEVLGFLTYVYRFDEAAEITWMAVRADRRRAEGCHGNGCGNDSGLLPLYGLRARARPARRVG